VPGAAEAHVALGVDVGELQVGEHAGAVEEGVVVVPLVSLGVGEDGDRWEGVVVVDEVPVWICKVGLVRDLCLRLSL
jgi:hypothetical protein